MNNPPNTLTIGVKAVHPDATALPMHQTAGAACVDLHVVGLDAPVTLSPGQSESFGTGLVFEIPAGYAMLIYSRSGHGFKNGMRLVNGTGVIDSDYRGEVRVGLVCDPHGKGITISNGDRVAQAMVVPVPQVRYEFRQELGSTDRGTGGFGSTGQG